jgi:hypothetical protein
MILVYTIRNYQTLQKSLLGLGLFFMGLDQGGGQKPSPTWSHPDKPHGFDSVTH